MLGIGNARHHAASIQPQILRGSYGNCGCGRFPASATAKLKGQLLQAESMVTNGGDEMFHAPPEGSVCPVYLRCLVARLIRLIAGGRPDGECVRGKDRSLLSAADADNPTGGTAQRRRARPTLHP